MADFLGVKGGTPQTHKHKNTYQSSHCTISVNQRLTIKSQESHWDTGKGGRGVFHRKWIGSEKMELIKPHLVQMTGNKDVKQPKKISISKLRLCVRSKFL